MNDEARINGEVRMMKDRRFDFDISSVPSTSVIRRTTNPWDCAAKCKIDMASVLQQVSHLHSLGLEIFDVVRIGFAPNGHLFYHLKAITLKADNFLGVIRQKTELADTEIEEDLRAKAVIAQVAWVTKLRVCLNCIESFLLQLVRMNFCCQSNTASFLPHVNQDTSAFFLDLPKRSVQLISTVASPRAENIAGKTLAMHAHQRWLVLVDLAFHEREMMLAVELRPV